jgi:hypothetical protein
MKTTNQAAAAKNAMPSVSVTAIVLEFAMASTITTPSYGFL